MLSIGLTGSIGSGKSTVADLFSAEGVAVIDADAVAREVTAYGSAALEAIVEHFGDEILSGDGSLNRRAMRDIIFTDAAEREWLEKLLHPLIFARIQELTGQARSPYCIVMIPLLIETNAQSRVNHVLVVDAPPELCISRIMARDDISEAQAKQMLGSQTDRQTRLDAATDVIHNEGNKQSLQTQVLALHQRYLQLAKS